MLVNFGNFAIDIDRIFEIKKIIKGGFFNKKHCFWWYHLKAIIVLNVKINNLVILNMIV